MAIPFFVMSAHDAPSPLGNGGFNANTVSNNRTYTQFFVQSMTASPVTGWYFNCSGVSSSPVLNCGVYSMAGTLLASSANFSPGVGPNWINFISSFTPTMGQIVCVSFGYTSGGSASIATTSGWIDHSNAQVLPCTNTQSGFAYGLPVFGYKAAGASFGNPLVTSSLSMSASATIEVASKFTVPSGWSGGATCIGAQIHGYDAGNDNEYIYLTLYGPVDGTHDNRVLAQGQVYACFTNPAAGAACAIPLYIPETALTAGATYRLAVCLTNDTGPGSVTIGGIDVPSAADATALPWGTNLVGSHRTIAAVTKASPPGSTNAWTDDTSYGPHSSWARWAISPVFSNISRAGTTTPPGRPQVTIME